MVVWLANSILMSLSSAIEYAVCQSKPWDSRYVHTVGLALVEKERHRHWTSSSLCCTGAAKALVLRLSNEMMTLRIENMVNGCFMFLLVVVQI